MASPIILPEPKTKVEYIVYNLFYLKSANYLEKW